MQSSLQSSVKFVPDIKFLLLEYKVAADEELYHNRSEGRTFDWKKNQISFILLFSWVNFQIEHL